MAKTYKWLNQDSNPYKRLISVIEKKTVQSERITIGQKEEDLSRAQVKMRKANNAVTELENEILEIKKALGVEL